MMLRVYHRHRRWETAEGKMTECICVIVNRALAHREHMDRAMCFNDCRTRCISRKCYAKSGIRVIATKSEVRPFMDRKDGNIWNEGNRRSDGLTRLAVNLKRVRRNCVLLLNARLSDHRAIIRSP